jgi:hypothetical protein
MIRKTEEQLRKQALIKTARAALTVKYRNQLDRELNAVLPDLEDAFDDAVAKGIRPGDVDLKALVAGVLDEA